MSDYVRIIYRIEKSTIHAGILTLKANMAEETKELNGDELDEVAGGGNTISVPKESQVRHPTV